MIQLEWYVDDSIGLVGQYYRLVTSTHFQIDIDVVNLVNEQTAVNNINNNNNYVTCPLAGGSVLWHSMEISAYPFPLRSWTTI